MWKALFHNIHWQSRGHDDTARITWRHPPNSPKNGYTEKIKTCHPKGPKRPNHKTHVSEAIVVVQRKYFRMIFRSDARGCLTIEFWPHPQTQISLAIPWPSSPCFFRFACLSLLSFPLLSHLGVLQRPLTLRLPQKHRDANGSCIMIQIAGLYTAFCQEEGTASARKWLQMNTCNVLSLSLLSWKGK